MPSIDWLAGVYEGTGSWHESTGRSQSYRVRQTNRGTGTGFEILFHHDFDDGSVVNAHFTMSWRTPSLFAVSAAGKPMGNGYLIDRYCHYHLEVGAAFVEVSLMAVEGGLHVFGSSTKNAAGHYIAWHEKLQLAPASAGA
jgi:hypothetical protein